MSMLIFSLSPRDVSTYSSGWTCGEQTHTQGDNLKLLSMSNQLEDLRARVSWTFLCTIWIQIYFQALETRNPTPETSFHKQSGEAHLLGEIILQLRNEQDQHDDATDDGHCRDTEEERILETPASEPDRESQYPSAWFHRLWENNFEKDFQSWTQLLFISTRKWFDIVVGYIYICINHVCSSCTMNTFLLYYIFSTKLLTVAGSNERF